MALTLGRNFLVLIGSNAVLGQKSGTISVTMDTVETTVKGTTTGNSNAPLAKQYLPAIYGWEVTLNGAYDLSDTKSLATTLKAGTVVTVHCNIGGQDYTGSGIITSFSSTGDQGDLTTYDVTIQGTGGLTVPS